LQESEFSFSLKKSSQCVDGAVPTQCPGVLLGTMSRHQGLAVNKLAPFSGLSLLSREAPWLIKNLDRDERGHRDRCPMTSTTIYGQQFDEREGPPRGIDPSGP
jgi:hypothetical protein